MARKIYIGAAAYHAREKHWLRGWKACWYAVTFNYWDEYFGSVTRFECGVLGFLNRTRKGMKTEIAIHRYSMNDGAGQIGRYIWGKVFNEPYKEV